MNGGEIMLGFILGSLFGGTVGVFTMGAMLLKEQMKKKKIFVNSIKAIIKLKSK